MGVVIQSQLCYETSIINRMPKRGNYDSLCVCYRSICSSVDLLSNRDTTKIGTIPKRLLPLDFTEIALFKSYCVIYLPIDAAIYDVV